MYTIRVYGIFVKDGRVLLSSEKYGEKEMLKFPGGGLEYGESTIECLQREINEEYGMQIEVKEHFYTTDFFVPSAFHQNTGVMSIYYLIQILQPEIPVDIIFEDDQSIRMLQWFTLEADKSNNLTFPIDQKVFRFLLDANK